MKYKIDAKTGEVALSVQKKLYSVELLQGAAYVLTDRCVAYVEAKGTAHEVTLKSTRGRSRPELEALGDAFVNELLNQALRQKLVSANRAIMEHVITRALVSATAEPEGQDAAAEALSAEQQAEIDKLIAEAEAEIATLSKRKGGADPLGITKTWEEVHGKRRAA